MDVTAPTVWKHLHLYLFYFSGFFQVSRCLLGGIYSLRESPERFHVLENVSRASIGRVLSSKCVKFPFWLTYPANNPRCPCCEVVDTLLQLPFGHYVILVQSLALSLGAWPCTAGG